MAEANYVGVYSAGPDNHDPLGWVLRRVTGLDENGIDPNLSPTYADNLSLSYEREIGRRTSLELTYVDKKTQEAFDAYNLDLQLSKGFTINNLRFVLIGAVYNTFSTEYGTGVCNSPSGCGEYEMGDATTWTTPRRYEIGFRFEF